MSTSSSTSTPATTTRRTPAADGRKRIWRIVGLVVLSSFGLLFALLASILIFGRIQGEEFSAERFQRREFLYYEIPLIGLQIWPISRETTTNELELWLVNHQYVPVAGADASAPSGEGDRPEDSAGEAPTPQGDTAREQATDADDDPADDDDAGWDMVISRRGASVSGVGDARILCRYLDAKTNDGELLWLKWSDDNPKLARVAWSLVSRLARQQMYVFVPDVLEGARTAQDAERFEREINRQLAGRYLDLALAQQQQNRHRVALSLIEDGLSFEPDNRRLLAAREASRGVLDSDKAP